VTETLAPVYYARAVWNSAVLNARVGRRVICVPKLKYCGIYQGKELLSQFIAYQQPGRDNEEHSKQ
jgi:hypothetical protein